MKRAASVLLAITLAMSLAGCAPSGRPSVSPGTSTPTSESANVAPYAAIPSDGAHEKAAYDALPAALAYVEKTTREQNREVTDVTGGKATLVSYTLEAEVGSRICLFEVRGDGNAYELYRYPSTPDPANLFWQDAATSEGAHLAEPAGTGELAAAAAVRKIVEQAATGETVTISMYGYNFYWITGDGTPVNTPGGGPFTISIDPTGAAGSWSN